MEKFEFINPVKIIFGHGEVKRTGKEAKKLGHKAMIVSYKQHDALGGVLNGIEAMLKEEGVTAIPFYAITANPTLTQVKSGIELCRAKEADLVIAVGGGSAMDAAKFIAAGVFHKGDPWLMTFARLSEGSAVLPQKALPMIMVTTLPATGSEMNCGAVVTNEDIKEKSYTWAECLYPKISILDPELTFTLPPYQTSCGAIDAISHAMETFLNQVDNCPIQSLFNAGLIRTIMTNVRKALNDPNDLIARTNLMLASTVAWNGWTRVGTGAAAPMHEFGMPISGRHNITHGAAMSIMMCGWMKYTYKRDIDRYVQLATLIFDLSSNGLGKEAIALEGIKRLEDFFTSANVETKLSQAHIPIQAIDDLSEDVIRMSFLADGTFNSRVRISKEDVKKIYTLAL